MSTKIITFEAEGNFDKTRNFLKAFKAAQMRILLNQYGQKIVAMLESETPKRTGATASSWYYTVVGDAEKVALEIHNSNMGSDGKTPVAILIQMGHGTRTGGYVPAIDYINPVVKPLFDELEEKIMGAVKSL